MLADAFHAENYRFWKNRMTVLWSTAFVPVAAVLIGALGNFVVKTNGAKIARGGETPAELQALMASSPLDVGAELIKVAGGLAGPVVLLFVMIGAATIYAGDYRWETWRLISARNSRPNLLLAKLATVAVLGLVAMALMFVAGVVDIFVRGAIFERPLDFGVDGADLGKMAVLSGLSWLRLLQFTMMALLAATITRSLLAALFVPLVVGVGGFFAPNLLGQMGIMPDAWLTVLLNPGGAIETIQGVEAPKPNDPAVAQLLLIKSWLSAGLWTLVPLAGALAWFRRQDLSKE